VINRRVPSPGKGMDVWWRCRKRKCGFKRKAAPDRPPICPDHEEEMVRVNRPRGRASRS
jgi:hypothetical protein